MNCYLKQSGEGEAFYIAIRCNFVVFDNYQRGFRPFSDHAASIMHWLETINFCRGTIEFISSFMDYK